MQTESKSTDTTEKRRHPRAKLWMMARVRRLLGESEIVYTRNVSRGGVRFVSQQRYYVNDPIKISCPYTGAGPNLEIDAKIVSRREIRDSPDWIYGASYLQTPSGRN